MTSKHGVACLPGEFVGLIQYDSVESRQDSDEGSFSTLNEAFVSSE